MNNCVFAEASFAFSIYDFDGSGKIDAYNLGDVLRALNSNPILATIEKLGGTKKKGEKFLTVSFINDLRHHLPAYTLLTSAMLKETTISRIRRVLMNSFTTPRNVV